MKTVKRMLAVALVILAVCAVIPSGSVSAATAQRAYVNYSGVRIRESASTSSAKLAEVTNVYLTVTGKSGDWYAVTYNGISGYMYGTYVDFVPTAMPQQQANVTSNGVRIREQASTLRAILDEVSYVTVTVTGIVYTGMKYPWYAVTYNGISGYIYGQYIELIEPEVGPEADPEFENEITEFPESYKPYLRSLHAKYPNWVFRADKLSMSFDEAVKNENIFPRKLVNLTTEGVSWRSMDKGSYNWTANTWTDTASGWTGAAKQVIEYYMDPRNFLNSNYVYMFLQQSYDSSQTAEGLAKIVSGTFLEKGYSDSEDTQYGGSYINVIMEAARRSGVSAYVLASTIIQEQGVNGASDLISGTTNYGKYFNFFNIKASDDDVVGNGLRYAQSQGWTTRSAAIIGGAEFYANGYISGGQDTYFYKNFDLLSAPYYTHQYAQNIYDSRSSAALISDAYSTNYNAPLIFRIPVYTSIPDTVAQRPIESDLRNNHYLLSMSVDGFSMYQYNYSLSVSGDRVIEVTLPDGASLVSNEPYRLSAGGNTVEIAVRAETGYTNSYYIAVNAAKECVLYISPCGGSHSPSEWIVDTEPENYAAGSKSRYCLNCGVVIETAVIPPLKPISAETLVWIRQQLLFETGDMAADVNGDKKINILDLIRFKKMLAGK